LCLGTAARILRPIKYIEVNSPDDLLMGVQKIPWEKWFHPDKTFAVYASGSHPAFSHTGYAALVVKDGIVDRFRIKTGKRPSVDRENAMVRIELHLNKRHCTVSLDASGDSLHKRGYRQEMTMAPMSEVLANGLIRLTGYRGDRALYDPMCGSGTLAIEAAIIADRLPAGIYRKSFGFMHWLDYDKELHALIEAAALKRISESPMPIFASDIDRRAMDVAENNAVSALVDERITWSVEAFESTRPPAERGILVINPPYGRRLETDVEETFSRIGAHLREHYTGWTAWVVVPSAAANKALQMKAAQRIPFQNGDLDCMWQQFDIYES
jgi:putative N6-adenine-specific DNA methylase